MATSNDDGSPKKEAKDGMLNRFCQTTPLHGFLYIQEQSHDKSGKVNGGFWLILIACCIIGAAYQITMVAMQYHSENTAFSVAIVDAEEMKFPDILLCNMNPINATAVEDYQLEHTTIYATLEMFSWGWDLHQMVMELQDPTIVNTVRTNINLADEFIREHNLTFNEMVMKLGHICSQMLSVCTTGKLDPQTSQLVLEDCCRLARPVIYVGYGVCYVIRGVVRSKHEEVFGHFASMFHTQVALNEQDYIRQQSRFSEGILVGFAREFQMELENELMALPPATFSLLNIKTKKVTNVPTTKRHCNTKTEDSLYMCQERCELSFFTTSCKCVPLFFGHHDGLNVSQCGLKQLFDCLTLNVDVIEPIIDNCKKQCQKPCTTWSYDVTSTHLPYTLKKSLNETMQKKARAPKLKAYMINFRYEQVTEFLTMTLESMLGNVGGLLGVYVGGSALAIVHFFTTILSVLTSRTKELVNSREEKKKDKNGTNGLIKDDAEMKLLTNKFTESPNHVSC